MKKNTGSVLSNMSDAELHEIVNRIVHFRQNIIQNSQEQFAASLNVTQSYISRVENGDKAVTENLIQRICSLYEVDLNWLLFGLENPEPSITEETSNTPEKSLSKTRMQAINQLKVSYALKNTDIDFLSWYLNLAPVDRASFTRSIKELRRILDI